MQGYEITAESLIPASGLPNRLLPSIGKRLSSISIRTVLLHINIYSQLTGYPTGPCPAARTGWQDRLSHADTLTRTPGNAPLHPKKREKKGRPCRDSPQSRHTPSTRNDENRKFHGYTHGIAGWERSHTPSRPNQYCVTYSYKFLKSRRTTVATAWAPARSQTAQTNFTHYPLPRGASYHLFLPSNSVIRNFVNWRWCTTHHP